MTKATIAPARLHGTIMVQGTTSDAGKSTLVAALCRWLHRKGLRVAPFKPQNMSLNSAVASDGGEIGRAQALQALAAGTPAQSDMNPVLLKPSSDTMAQVILNGRVACELDAREYHAYKVRAKEAVDAAYGRLAGAYDVIVVEGAGSPAEVNLRERDIANMGFAESVDCPVILIADIDRGGVFAHIVGTLECLAPSERDRIAGFVINRFRGDRALLEPGLAWLQSRTSKPVFGVLPYLHGLNLDAEDGIEVGSMHVGDHDALKVVVPVYPRISNHTDLDPLRVQPGVELVLVGPGHAWPRGDLVILPGSKNTRADLRFLIDHGFDREIRRHLRYGGKLIGICGGMQMLGNTIADPEGIEGAPGTTEGLSLIDMETRITVRKMLENVSGHLCLDGRPQVTGYEIHMGTSTGSALGLPAIELPGRVDGALSDDGQILATYVHGLFDHPAACAALLRWAGAPAREIQDRRALREKSIDRLADAIVEHLDMGAIGALLDRAR